jgi:glutamate racemase
VRATRLRSLMNKPPLRAMIGVFDSGVGGLTVLQALRQALPQAPLHYLADNAYAPYGEKSSDFIAARSLVIGDYLIAHGACLLVVACNTATAHAVNALRQRWPELPIVGIEPGIKPAVAASRNGRVGVLATPATIASARYQALVAAHAQGTQVFSQPCPGLADLIETGELDSPAMRALIERCCAPLRAANVDTVLMGCTHYPFVQPLLQETLGSQVQLLNVEAAVARQAQRCWTADGDGGLVLQSSGDPAVLDLLARRALAWAGPAARQVKI